MVDYNSTIPTFDQIEGNTLLQKMREMYNVLIQYTGSGNINNITFNNGIIKFFDGESEIYSVDLSDNINNIELLENSLILTKLNGETSNVSLLDLITNDTIELENNLNNLILETNKSFVNAEYDAQTSILKLTSIDGSILSVTIPSGGGSGGGNVSNVEYDDNNKTITVTFVTGEPKVYTLTQLVTLDSSLNSINENIQNIETNLEELQTKTDKSFVDVSFDTASNNLTFKSIDNSEKTVNIPASGSIENPSNCDYYTAYLYNLNTNTVLSIKVNENKQIILRIYCALNATLNVMFDKAGINYKVFMYGKDTTNNIKVDVSDFILSVANENATYNQTGGNTNLFSELLINPSGYDNFNLTINLTI